MSNLLIVDVESTGLYPDKGDQVIEIAVVRLDREGDHELLYETLVKPTVPIKFAAMGANNITEEMAATGIPWKDARREFERVRAEYPGAIGAHNADFDRRMMRYDDEPGWLDTLRLARHAFPYAENHKAATLKYELGIYKSLEQRELHRAAADAVLAAEICRLSMKELRIVNWTALQYWGTKPALMHTMPMGKYRGLEFSEVPEGYLYWMLRNDFTGDLRYTAQSWLSHHARNRNRAFEAVA